VLTLINLKNYYIMKTFGILILLLVIVGMMIWMGAMAKTIARQSDEIDRLKKQINEQNPEANYPGH